MVCFGALMYMLRSRRRRNSEDVRSACQPPTLRCSNGASTKKRGMLVLGLFCVLGLPPTCASRQASAERQEGALRPYVDEDAYRVYAVLLGNAKYSPFTIQSETESFPRITPKNIGINGDRKFWKVWGSAVKDLAEKYHQQLQLTKDIPIEAPYEVVPRRELIERAQPGTGYYTFSAVGFDPGKTHAVVDMMYQCFGWCGHGSLHFLQKVNGKWREVPVNAETEVLFF